MRSTIRSNSRRMMLRADIREKVDHIWKLPGAKERLQLVRADLLEEGSFDDAVMACEGVFHLASPVLAKSDSSSKVEMVVPSVNGTLNLLRSCKKSPFLKRVVLTSSSSAVRIRDDLQKNILLDETSWSSLPLCEEMQIWYALAKISAEKAAWQFAKENDIDLVTVLPSFVIGPSLSHNLRLTASEVLGLFRGDTALFSSYGRMGYVHIDDVASSHILAYEKPEATGRYLCSSVVLDNNELLSFLANRYRKFPIPRRKSRVPKHSASSTSRFSRQLLLRAASFSEKRVSGKLFQTGPFSSMPLTEQLKRSSELLCSLKNAHGRQSYQLNTSKMQDLGIKFKGIQEMFDDCVGSLKHQGHLQECPLR